MPKIEELEAELEKIKAEMAVLKALLPGQPKPRKPWAGPIDYTARAVMPSAAVAAMVQAVGDDQVAAIARELRNPPGPSSLSNGSEGPARPIGRNGWIDETPNKPPPGIELIDRLVDAQDALDRAERERRFKAE